MIDLSASGADLGDRHADVCIVGAGVDVRNSPIPTASQPNSLRATTPASKPKPSRPWSGFSKLSSNSTRTSGQFLSSTSYRGNPARPSRQVSEFLLARSIHAFITHASGFGRHIKNCSGPLRQHASSDGRASHDKL